MAGSSASRPKHILVTGATGYVGGRLVPCLLDEGYTVRCFVRSPERLSDVAWAGDVEVVQGDALDYDTIPPALDGVDAAYYLIHSLATGDDFQARDRQAAGNFGRACREAGVGRIIYLGGIQPKGTRESEHLRSRLETGERLRQWDVPVTEFRAAVVVGSGSLSFEIIRYLTERLPILLCPRWVQTPTQPIAVRDVLAYLVEALERPESVGETFEIGGADVLSYGDMFRIYAEVRGLPRILVNIPVLTPRLSAHWVGVVTPVTNRIARPLIAGLDNEVVVEDDRARRVFSVEPIRYEAAVRLALRRFARGDISTSWHGAFSSGSGRAFAEELEDAEGMIQEKRTLRIQATPDEVWHVVRSVGGETGWFYAEALWRVRGFFDLLLGGVGLRRGRRSPTDLRVGDALDFWRVEAVEPARLLRLRAEMKVPGRAWLEFRIEPPGEEDEDGRTCLTQTAYFEPKGLLGLMYWWLFYPAHKLIFPGMIHEIGRRAEALKQAHRQGQQRALTAPA